MSFSQADNTTNPEWSTWLGPNENGIISESLPNLTNLKLNWKKELGLGYSSAILSGDLLFCLGHDGKAKETLYCIDKTSGKTLWSKSYKADLIPKLHAGGPNASTLIHEEKLYSISKDGQVFCLNPKDGTSYWETTLTKLFDAPVPSFGFSASPMIMKGQLILSQGKTASLNPETGKVNWVSDTKGSASYASPKFMSYKGSPYIISMSSEGANVIDFNTGKNIASFAMKAKYSMIGATPVLTNNEGEFFASTNQTNSLLKFDGKNLKAIWTNTNLNNSFNTSLFIDGYLYGIDGNHKSSRSKIVCLNAKTGKVTWEKSKTGFGSLIAGNEKICFLSEDGELVNFEINPKQFKATSKKKVLGGICWTPPTITNNTIYVRNEPGLLLSLSNK